MVQLDDETKKAIFGEAILDELRAIHECVGDVADFKARMARHEEKIASLLLTLSAMKAVVKDHSKHLNNHVVRIRKLDALTAS